MHLGEAEGDKDQTQEAEDDLNSNICLPEIVKEDLPSEATEILQL